MVIDVAIENSACDVKSPAVIERVSKGVPAEVGAGETAVTRALSACWLSLSRTQAEAEG
jgi:hypothetical protein